MLQVASLAVLHGYDGTVDGIGSERPCWKDIRLSDTSGPKASLLAYFPLFTSKPHLLLQNAITGPRLLSSMEVSNYSGSRILEDATLKQTQLEFVYPSHWTRHIG